jgi:hypothetical protein
VASAIPEGSIIYTHSKRHGTSFRVAKTKCVKGVTGWKQKVNHYTRLNVFNPSESMEYVVGTRNVVLKPQDKEKDGFHGSEAFRFEVMDVLKPYLDDGMSVYGEIYGYVNGKPIMSPHDISKLKDKRYTEKYGKSVTYSYGCAEHEYKFHIYRITRSTVDGKNIDMSQQQTEQWCKDRNLPATLEIYPPFVYNGDVEALSKLVEQLTEREDLLTEDFEDKSHPAEGIILRCETGKDIPLFVKNKSYLFKVLEGICEAVDVEDAS